MIEIRNLKKSFGSHLIWENVNLDVNDGETLAVIGKSGSGKSVLLKHFNALLTPDEGYIKIDEQNIFEQDYVNLRKLRQRFGVLFQGAALFDSISAFENVAFPLRYFKVMEEDEIQERASRSLEMVDLKSIGDKSPAELSGGMRKRVGLARAIVTEPDYLLYDEPTSGLDPLTSDEINDLINYMSDSLDITSIVVTHDIHSVLKVAEKVAYIDNQEISWSGTLDEMKHATQENLREFIKASEYLIS